MKSNVRNLLFVFVLLLSASAVFAQVDSAEIKKFKGFRTPKFSSADNVVKSNLIPIVMGQIPICGEIRITYERMIWHKHSLTLGGSYNFPNLLLFAMPAAVNPMRATMQRYSMRGGRITFGYRYYPLSDEAPKGFFFGPWFSYNFVRIKEKRGDGSYADIIYTSANVIAGYQARFGKHIFFEVFGGLGYKHNYESDYDAKSKQFVKADLYNKKIPYFRNVKVVMQINLGYGW
jgi:hypothetical protein